MIDTNKIRLDQLLVDLGFFDSRNKASTCIMSNGVKIAGKLLNKPGHQINLARFHKDFEQDPDIIQVSDTMLEYVSRGAYKLKAAHEAWGLDFTDSMIMDIGASTGGFTEYALKHGAKKSLAIDVGKGQLHYKLRNDPRVVNLEETNFRNLKLETLIDCHSEERSDVRIQACLEMDPYALHSKAQDDRINFVVIDTSFISLITILEKLKSLIDEDKDHKYFDPNLKTIALIKPQFEAGKEIMDKCHGVIKDASVRQQVLETTLEKISSLGFKQEALIESPIHGAKGNVEYLVYLKL